MRYQNVCIESFGYTLPDEIVTSEELESRLEPLYTRLRLPAGRLELMTGIRERRFWTRDTLPSGPSVESAERAIRAAGLERGEIGALIHGSVCRDYLEPATAAGVHHRLGLPQECVVYDVSNACLGILNGVVQVANMIELGQIRAGLVVGTEGGRQLVENTIDELNTNTSLTREQMKLAVASLTIGSASAAILLTHRDLSRTGNRLVAATVRAATEHHELCHGGNGSQLLMTTDSERLLQEGVAAAGPAFAAFIEETGWSGNDLLDKTFCHQVGVAHKRLLFDSLGLDHSLDFTTVEFLGNTGSAALPVTAAIGIERGHLKPGDRVGMLGIGSGINVLMLGVEWQKSLKMNHEDTKAPREQEAREAATR